MNDEKDRRENGENITQSNLTSQSELLSEAIPKATVTLTREEYSREQRKREVEEFLGLQISYLTSDSKWVMQNNILPDEANLPTKLSIHDPVEELKCWSTNRMINRPETNSLCNDQERWCYSIVQYCGTDTNDEKPEDYPHWQNNYVTKLTILLKYLTQYCADTTRRQRHTILDLSELNEINKKTLMTSLRKTWTEVIESGTNYAL